MTLRMFAERRRVGFIPRPSVPITALTSAIIQEFLRSPGPSREPEARKHSCFRLCPGPQAGSLRARLDKRCVYAWARTVCWLFAHTFRGDYSREPNCTRESPPVSFLAQASPGELFAQVLRVNSRGTVSLTVGDFSARNLGAKVPA